MQFLNTAKALYEQALPQESSKVIACQTKEIETLENNFKLRLPEAYCEFLRWMGHDGGGFWSGYHCFYESLVDANLWGRNLLAKNGKLAAFPINAFVFYWDVSQSFCFFQTEGVDDPPVYIFMDSELEDFLRKDDPESLSPRFVFLKTPQMNTGFVRFAEKFSLFLLDEIKDHIKIRQRILQRPNRSS